MKRPERTVYYFSLLFAVCAFAACRKESTAGYNFTVITYTDSTGAVNGTVDSTDWGFDSQWTAAEIKLLSFKDTLITIDTSIGYVKLSAAFPNPCKGKFIIGVDVEKACKMKAVFVNERFEILHYTSRIFTGGPILTAYDFSGNPAFHRSNFYRMYYGYFDSRDSLYYKGHGDLQIE